jgi:hypothetical protein
MSFVVTGHNRTGSNLLFRMLVAGGLPTQVQRKELNLGSAHYHPNPHGYYEYTGEPIKAGEIIKHNGLADAGLPAELFHAVIVIRRDYDEVLLSHCKCFGASHGLTKQGYQTHYKRLYAWLNKHYLKHVTVEHTDLIRAPLQTLIGLQENGIPIARLRRAVALVDPTLYRCRVA